MEQYNNNQQLSTSKYPQSDMEIRMWCVEMAFEFLGRNNIEEAERLYNFVTSQKKEGQQELKM